MSDTSLKSTSAVAREENGNIQISINIPYALIETKKKEVLEEIAKNITVPGFRKGKAPLDEVEKNTDNSQIIEKVLGKLLPEAFSDTIEKEKIKPILYPKFELVSAEEGKDWQVRAITCELPQVELTDYKKIIQAESKAKAIWVPGKDKEEDKKDKKLSQQEKEQTVLEILVKTQQVKVPNILIDQEVDQKLSALLSRIEKLGLSLESYLSSLGKNPASLREEYNKQAEDAIKVELILQKIAEAEKIIIEDREIEEFIKAASVDKDTQEKLNSDDQKRFIKSMLAKRKTIEYLTSLM